MPLKQLAFAKTKSDSVVAKLNGGEESEASKKHKEARLEQKKRTRRGNEHRRRELAEKIAAKRGELLSALLWWVPLGLT